MPDDAELARLAMQARKRAYVPYSNFRVGAALLSESGQVYIGVNIENAAYSPTNCAERTAFFKAVSEGERGFVKIAVAGGYDDAEPEYCYPCGVCRQVMAEFCDPEGFQVIIVKDEQHFKSYSLKELLPFGFSPESLR